MVRDLRIAVDIGGTFTDVVLEEGGKRLTRKLLTTPQRPEEAVLDGVRLILADAGRGFGDVGVFVHGTTLATNAIIERKGARTALIATEGFRDVLEIANESRYDQYDLIIEKPKPLVPRALRFTVPERMDVHGHVRLALDEKAVRVAARKLKAEGVGKRRRRLHARLRQSRARAAHGEILTEDCRTSGSRLSSEVCPEMREYERTSTAVANAYVQPLMAGISRAPAGGSGGREIRRHDLPHDLGRQPHRLETARRYPGAAGRIGSGRRRDPRGARRGRARRGAGALLRHGRHHGQDLPDRRLQAAHRARCSRSTAPPAS